MDREDNSNETKELVSNRIYRPINHTVVPTAGLNEKQRKPTLTFALRFQILRAFCPLAAVRQKRKSRQAEAVEMRGWRAMCLWSSVSRFHTAMSDICCFSKADTARAWLPCRLMCSDVT